MPAHIAVRRITARVASSAPAVATTTQTTQKDAGIVAQGTMGRVAATTHLPISMCAALAATYAFTAGLQPRAEDATSTQPAFMIFSGYEVFCQGVKEPAFG